jgi:TRAP-type C4-dicarboxylate transport system substrate-binding protein
MKATTLERGGMSMKLVRRAVLAMAAAAAMTAGLGATEARAAEVIKIGTLAPAASPWGQVFNVWANAVSKKSEGALELQFFYNGQQGDEAAMVGKIKAGQLDGAAVTAVGLGKIYKPILALQMPGLFTSWAKLDAARDVLKPEFEKGANDAGFTLVGWGDVGLVHVMSKGFAVKTPDDMKGKKPYMWRDDDSQPVIFQVIGGITPVPLNIPEVLPNLNTGAIDIVSSPALAAEQLQWSSKLDTVTEDVVACALGAVVLSNKRIEALPENLRAILLDTGRIAAGALTKRIRAEDDAAFGRLKGKMTVVKLEPDQRAKWDGIFKQVRQRLGQGVFPADLVAKIEGLAK